MQNFFSSGAISTLFSDVGMPAPGRIDEILEWPGINAAIESLSEEINAQLEPMIEEMIRNALQSEAVADVLYNLSEISNRIRVALDQLEQKASRNP